MKTLNVEIDEIDQLLRKKLTDAGFSLTDEPGKGAVRVVNVKLDTGLTGNVTVEHRNDLRTLTFIQE